MAWIGWRGFGLGGSALTLLALLLFTPGGYGDAAAQESATYSDARAYCQAVQNADVPGPSYRGSATPDWIVQAVVEHPDYAGVVWRCAGGAVLACVEFNSLACMKAPWLDPASWNYVLENPDVRTQCRRTPTLDCVPGTHCVVDCVAGRPSLSRNNRPLESRGFYNDEWKTVASARAALSPSPAQPTGSGLQDGKGVARTSSAPFLKFPLDCATPAKPCDLPYTVGAYTVGMINSVLDHSMRPNPSTGNLPYGRPAGDGKDVITAFNGEQATGKVFDTNCLGGRITLRPSPDSEPLTNASGCRGDPNYAAYDDHPGYDYRAAMGTPVKAAAAGRILNISGSRCYIGNMDYTCEAWGFVGVDHGNGYVSQYGHLSRVLVKAGDTVTQGQIIGYSGSTAPPQPPVGPHLHFEVWKVIGAQYYLIDPYGWQGDGPDPLASAAIAPSARLWITSTSTAAATLPPSTAPASPPARARAKPKKGAFGRAMGDILGNLTQLPPPARSTAPEATEREREREVEASAWATTQTRCGNTSSVGMETGRIYHTVTVVNPQRGWQAEGGCFFVFESDTAITDVDAGNIAERWRGLVQIPGVQSYELLYTEPNQMVAWVWGPYDAERVRQFLSRPSSRPSLRYVRVCCSSPPRQ